MLVSVIIPCFNVENYIGECLDSVLHQTYSAIEIIVVDNNSTDRTSKVIEKYQKQHPGKIQFFQEKKQGAPHARNTGTKRARGEWIQYLDADDLLLPDKILVQVDLINKQKSPSSLIVGTQIYHYYNGKRKIFHPMEGNVYKALYLSEWGNTSSSLFETSAVLEADLWDETLICGQEYDLFFKIVTLGHSVLYDQQPNTIVRERKSGQISFSSPARNAKEFLNLRVRWTSLLLSQKPYWVMENQNLINDTYFKYILGVSRVSPQEAVNLYSKHLGEAYTPRAKNNSQISFLQEFGYSLFGFKKWIIIQRWLIRTIKGLMVKLKR